MAKEAAAGVVVDRTDRTNHRSGEVGCGGGAIGIAWAEELAFGIDAIEHQGDLAIGQGGGIEGGEIHHHGRRCAAAQDQTCSGVRRQPMGLNQLQTLCYGLVCQQYMGVVADLGAFLTGARRSDHAQAGVADAQIASTCQGGGASRLRLRFGRSCE